jgi:hypothetical protein
MKKLTLLALAAAFALTSCKKESLTASESTETPVMQRKCASMEVLEQQLIADPSLRDKMARIEDFTNRFTSNPDLARLSGDSMIIPVVVNVLYSKTSENINRLQIVSQIDVLNEDYKGVNADITAVPTGFAGVKAGDTKIRFVLDTIFRKATTKTSWTTNDAMKKSSQGGISPTSPTTKLNIWVCILGNGILGYAQFPGGNSSTDGVVIHTQAFGSKSKYSAGNYMSTYDKGRTATHEVGHWFNLRHIWGDSKCGDDLVGDTPLHTGANYGCPSYPTRSTCTGTPIMMTMDYMDYTDDACMYMFSAGQKTRMQATWATGGPRASFR